MPALATIFLEYFDVSSASGKSAKLSASETPTDITADLDGKELADFTKKKEAGTIKKLISKIDRINARIQSALPKHMGVPMLEDEAGNKTPLIRAKSEDSLEWQTKMKKAEGTNTATLEALEKKYSELMGIEPPKPKKKKDKSAAIVEPWKPPCQEFYINKNKQKTKEWCKWLFTKAPNPETACIDGMNSVKGTMDFERGKMRGFVQELKKPPKADVGDDETPDVDED